MPSSPNDSVRRELAAAMCISSDQDKGSKLNFLFASNHINIDLLNTNARRRRLMVAVQKLQSVQVELMFILINSTVWLPTF